MNFENLFSFFNSIFSSKLLPQDKGIIQEKVNKKISLEECELKYSKILKASTFQKEKIDFKKFKNSTQYSQILLLELPCLTKTTTNYTSTLSKQLDEILINFEYTARRFNQIFYKSPLKFIAFQTLHTTKVAIKMINIDTIQQPTANTTISEIYLSNNPKPETPPLNNPPTPKFLFKKIKNVFQESSRLNTESFLPLKKLRSFYKNPKIKNAILSKEDILKELGITN